MRVVAQRAAISCLALTFGAVAPLMAQACIGYPTDRGQMVLNPGITFGDNTTSFGALANANLADELALEGGFGITSYDDRDSNGVDFSGRVAYELNLAGDMPDVSVCPYTGLGYARVSDDGATRSGLVLPLGVGVGKTFPAGTGYTFSLSGAPHFLLVRQSSSREGFDDVSETDFEFGLSLNATLGTERFYGGFSLGITTVEDSDTSFRVGVGIPFGNN